MLVIGNSRQEEIDVWSFRSDNENNDNVQASYTGPRFTKEWKDFSICLRYKILYFFQGSDGFNIFTTQKGTLCKIRQV